MAEETARVFDELSAEAKQDWIDRFVREEALVREAEALGLDRDDELIRRRLVQKMEFLTIGLADEASSVNESELSEFYEEHVEDYRFPTTLTFLHVFVRVAENPALAQENAKALAAQMNAAAPDPQAALSLGDRFLYNRNYVDRTFDEVQSHFGPAFAQDLASRDVDETAWSEPLRSEHGWHIVLLTRRVESHLPTLPEIAGTLRNELADLKRNRALARGVDQIVSQFDVELAPDLDSIR